MASNGATARLFCCCSRPLPRPWSANSPSLRTTRVGHVAIIRPFHSSRQFSADGASGQDGSGPTVSRSAAQSTSSQVAETLGEYKKYFHFPSAYQASELQVGKKVTVHGFLSRRRVKHSKLVFADIRTKTGPPVQITSSFEEKDSPASLVNKALKSIPLHSPVSVTGTVTKLHSRDADGARLGPNVDRIDLSLDSIQALNPFPRDIIVSDGVQFPASSRHLQIRFSESLRERLVFRSHVSKQLRDSLDHLNFCEYETPILFKSTPEGAREFIVPSRRRGLAYALPQSPQQYKQILVASGVGNYYQFARCFRDEDLRSDRQPEFTQLDLEMAFATGEDVMRTVEALIKDLLKKLGAGYTVRQVGDELVPYPKSGSNHTGASHWQIEDAPFPRITYQEAMEQYGSDKPDVRIPCVIRRIDSILPRPFVQMISDLEEPVVEAIKLRLEGNPPENWSFIRSFMDSLPTSLAKNPHGAPAVLMFDTSKPMCGLSSLGHEAFAALTSGGPGFEDFADLEDGDVLVIQARENKPFQGGSTALGNLRLAAYQDAISKGLVPRDDSFNFLWVHGFPLFTPDSDEGPGQGGRAGFSATHHPFTAPLTDADFELLASDPLKARADHYDLVVNGVELGGGSRRIHVAKVQEYVMRHILEMPDDGVAQFAHLLEALRAGCPPHAGFALGFDRLVALLSGTGSVRDVIVFPKSMKGEDLMVKSPGRITGEQLQTYHLALQPKK